MIANNKSVTKNCNDGTSHVIGQKNNVMGHGQLIENYSSNPRLGQSGSVLPNS